MGGHSTDSLMGCVEGFQACGAEGEGVTILSPIQITSSTMLKSPSTVEYDWMEAGSEGRSASSMQNMRYCNIFVSGLCSVSKP